MPPGSTGSSLLLYPEEALRLQLVEGSEKKQEKLCSRTDFKLATLCPLQTWTATHSD